MRPGPLLATHAAVLLVASTAWAEPVPHELPRTMRLEYHVSPGTRCEATAELLLRLSVSNQMHHEPFDEQATARMVTTFRRTEAGYVGHADLLGSDGAVLWSREVIPLATCADAIETVALAIAFKLEPPAGPPPPAPPPTATPTSACTCCACAPAPARPPEPTKPPMPTKMPEPVKPPIPAEPPERRVRVGAGLAMGFGVAPGPAAGLTVDLGIRWPFFSASVEGRAYLPARVIIDGNAPVISTYRVTGALVPCGHWRALVLCVPIEMGTQHAVAEPAREGTFPYAAVGVRVGGEFPLPGGFLARLSGDLLAAGSRPQIVVTNTASWTAPLFAGALNAGVLTYF